MEHLAGGSKRLRPWLIEQINSGQYPGLRWEDEEKITFRIPWKHAGKQDYRQDEDAALFKAWAVFKGKFKVNDRPDPPAWKTRLRCALNKSSDFMEVTERSQLDISEPYKVYKIISDNFPKEHDYKDSDDDPELQIASAGDYNQSFLYPAHPHEATLMKDFYKQPLQNSRLYWPVSNETDMYLEQTQNSLLSLPFPNVGKEVEMFREGGPEPQFKIVLCFCEELGEDTPRKKLVTAHVEAVFARQYFEGAKQCRPFSTGLERLQRA